MKIKLNQTRTTTNINKMQQQERKLVFLFLLILNLIGDVCMQGAMMPLTSPCPDTFRYRFDGNKWFGLLTIRDPSPGQPLHLNVALSISGKPATNYLGEIKLITRGQYMSTAPVLYKVKFPKTHFPPKLLQVKVNNEIVCYGSAEHAVFMTQIQLEHTRKYHFLPDDTSLPLTTGFGLPSNTGMDQQMQQHADSIADDMVPKSLAFGGVGDGGSGSKQLPLTKFNAPLLQAKDICGTIDNRIRFQRGRIMASKFRRAAGAVAIDKIVDGTNVDNEESEDLPSDDTDYHNDDVDDHFNDGKKAKGGASTIGIPLVTTADISAQFTLDAKYKTAIEHLPTITRGAWPWLAAVYVNNLTSLFYQCGGTLISAHIVISSAHCFATSTKNYAANELLVFLGRHNLNNWNEEGSIAAPVDDIFIHPQFDSHLNSYDADIAVLVLKNPVRFNSFIRPACLWSGATNTKYINGERGVVVGWGSTRAQSLFSNVMPRVIEAPIVSNDVCFKADDKFFSLSSNRTFCAGIVFNKEAEKEAESNKPHSTTTKAKELNRKHKEFTQQRRRISPPQPPPPPSSTSSFSSGPCSGDSGAGLMILKNNRWFLRGIVSASLPMDNNDSVDADVPTQLHTNSKRFACNINQYVIYTDVAKFLDWIYAFII